MFGIVLILFLVEKWQKIIFIGLQANNKIVDEIVIKVCNASF
jgi:hypothetical protein